MSAQQKAGVDVLAVMDADRIDAIPKRREFAGGAYLELETHRSEQARAAVAELIEAASEVDRLSRDFSVWDDPESVERAVLRQRAALARVQGGAA